MKAVLRTFTAMAALSLGALALSGPAQAGTAPPGPSSSPVNVAAMRAALRAGTLGSMTGVYDVCAANGLACQAEGVSAAAGSSQLVSTNEPIGWGATDLEQAYGLSSAPAGSGTVAIIDAGAYPSLESDLSIYRSTYHLSTCFKATGCLRVVNFDGGPERTPAKGGFGKFVEEEIAVETSLDVDMASAACPSCKLIELQVPWQDGLFGTTQQMHAAELHFATAVATAKKMGATAVSISYGYPIDSYSDKGKPAQLMKIPGLAVTSSSGDDGFFDSTSQWPQDLPNVISVGGTSLTDAGHGKFAEAAWDFAGSGCSTDLPPANGQPASVSANCFGTRTSTDISAVADPTTGVAVYDAYAPSSGFPLGFITVGGTSASSPFIAGAYARAGVSSSVLGPNKLYAAPASAFNDVIAGANAPHGYCSSFGIGERVCMAGTGWDGPTGRGTPNGLAPFK